MRSHELARILLGHPDCEVVLQKDEEGNGYKSCRGADHDVVCVNDCGEIEVYAQHWTADEAGLDEDEWATMKQRHTGYVVLYP